MVHRLCTETMEKGAKIIVSAEKCTIGEGGEKKKVAPCTTKIEENVCVEIQGGEGGGDQFNVCHVFGLDRILREIQLLESCLRCEWSCARLWKSFMGEGSEREVKGGTTLDVQCWEWTVRQARL
jgi:hypothetical protein